MIQKKANRKLKIANSKLLLVILLAVILLMPIKTYAVEENGYIIESGKITGYTGSETEIEIPETMSNGTPITTIGKGAFRNNRNITKVIIPGTIKTIEEEAFMYCAAIQELTLEEGIETIKKFAFQYNVSLTQITIPGSVKVLESGAFSECRKINKVVVEDGVKNIGSGVFIGLTSLELVELPGSIEKIEQDTFTSSATDFIIKAPHYRLNNNEIEETPVSKLAKNLSESSHIEYTPTNYVVYIDELEGGKITVDKRIAEAGETIQVNLNLNYEYEKERLYYTLENGTDIEITGSQITMPAFDITISAELNVITYKIKASAGQNGTISPLGETEVIIGRNQTYKITPNNGYIIDKILIDGEEIESKSKTYIFQAVVDSHEIHVTFMQLQYYSLIMEMNDIIETIIQKEVHDEITIETGETTNFESWNTVGIEAQTEKKFLFYMPTQPVTITYNFSETNYEDIIIEETATVNGTSATATIDQNELSNKIQNTDTRKIQISIENTAATTELQVTISDTNLQEIINKNSINELKIEADIGSIAFTKTALEEIVKQTTGGNIIIKIKKCSESDLSAAQKEVVGDNPVYKFEIINQGNTISQFRDELIITLPYTLATGENENGVKVFFITTSGNIEEKPTVYKNNMVTFMTNHFSEYYIKNIIESDNEDNKDNTNNEDENQQTPSKPNKPGKPKDTTEKIEQKLEIEGNEEIEEIKLNFTDVKENAWYTEAIKYVVKNNIASGTSLTTFNPNDPITRGQVATMLCKAYNINGEKEGENFSDVNNEYYAEYMLALKNRNILSGVGNNKAEPKREITRQELLVLIYKIMEYTNNLVELPKDAEEITYEDANEIAKWAKHAVEYFSKIKIISGYNGKVNPKGKTTRAEMAQIIYNINNNVIKQNEVIN